MLKDTIKKMYYYFWDKGTKEAIIYWGRLIISIRGIWFFVPVLWGILTVYWLMGHGFYDTEATIKPFCDSIALWIIIPAAIVFLIRVLLYKKAVDIVLLVMAVNL